MTQEDKNLLLKDLCARLPYGNTEIKVTELTNDMMSEVFVGKHICSTIDIEDFILGKYIIRPYLRPLSSMTEEEKEEYDEWHLELESGRIKDWKNADYIDWLNAHHFDYRGLIPKCIALVAPEDMYKN